MEAKTELSWMFVFYSFIFFLVLSFFFHFRSRLPGVGLSQFGHGMTQTMNIQGSSDNELPEFQLNYLQSRYSLNLFCRSGPTSPFGTPPVYAQIRHFAQSPVLTFRHMPISKNPYMSPYLASDSMLKQMCPVHFVVSFYFTKKSCKAVSRL